MHRHTDPNERPRSKRGGSRRSAPLLLLALFLGLVPVTAHLAVPTRALATGLYESAVMGDTPSAYYRLGESSGTTATDTSGNGNNGTYSAIGVTLGTTGAITNDTDTAATFGGSSGEMTVPDNADLDPASQITLEAWFKPIGALTSVPVTNTCCCARRAAAATPPRTGSTA